MAKTPRSTLDVDWNKISDDEATTEIARLIGECAKQNKMSPQDLTWADFKEFTKYAFGASETGLKPKHITRVGGFLAIKDAFFPPEVGVFSIEKQNILNRARLNRSVSLEATRNALLMQQIDEITTRVFKGRIVPAGFASRKSQVGEGKIKRQLNLLLSDLHIRSLLDEREVGASFGAEEEARRLANVCLQTATYKEQYRDQTQLNVHLVGDIIQGVLHDQRDGAPLAEQVAAAQFLLVQAIGYFSRHFPKVVVRCTPGNHGRNSARHHGRAVKDKWDAIETCIYHAVKMASSSLPNVSVEIPRTPFITYEAFGLRGWGTHGDSVFNPGFPGKNIQTGRLEADLNKLNASLPDTAEYRVAFFGHIHTGSITWLQNGACVITNGALLPPDSYARSIGIHEASCGQMLWESVPGFIVGDSRFLRVGPEHDKDATLDKIIKPFEDF